MPADNTIIVELDEVTVIAEPVTHTIVAGAAQGATGPAGPAGSEIVERTAGETLVANRVVALSAVNQAEYADHTDTSALRVFGVTDTGGTLGATVTIRTQGVMDWIAGGLTTGLPLFLTTDGQLSHTPPVTGYVRQIGVALAAAKIQVSLGTAVLQE